MNLIKSISYDQQEIINNILELYNNSEPIDFDPCYNVGGFYRNNVIHAPRVKSDINPLVPGVQKLDVRDLPFADNVFNTIIFDPPFIVSAGVSGKMAKLYGAYPSYDTLLEFYKATLLSLQRVLKNNGILIFKCQDIVNGRKNYIVHNDIINMAGELGYKCIDIFILLAKSRATAKINKQQHARKFHSYFLVFRNKK